jgi:hypothetical protein
MHDLIFENQKEMSPEKYLEYAAQLGLDIEQFKIDVESDAVDNLAVAVSLVEIATFEHPRHFTHRVLPLIDRRRQTGRSAPTRATNPSRRFRC